MFAAQSKDHGDGNDWVKDGLNEEVGNEDAGGYAGGDDGEDEEEEDQDYAGSDADADADAYVDAEDAEDDDDDDDDDGDDDDDDDDDGDGGDGGKDEEESGSSGESREETVSSGQSDLDTWYAQVCNPCDAPRNLCCSFRHRNSVYFALQDSVDYSRLPKPAPSAAEDHPAIVPEIDAAAAALAASRQEAYNKEFERAALFDVLMRDTPRPDDEETGVLKCAAAARRPRLHATDAVPQVPGGVCGVGRGANITLHAKCAGGGPGHTQQGDMQQGPSRALRSPRNKQVFGSFAHQRLQH
jgi:hypothetical protein